MIDFFVNRRQSGKTSRCIEVYKDLVKQDYDAVYLVHSYNEVNRITHLMKNQGMRRYIVSNNFRDLFSSKPTNLVVDEYLFFKPKDQKLIDEYVYVSGNNHVEYVYVETTSNRLYNRELLTLVSILRDCHINPMRLKSVIDKQYLEQLEILNDNLLTNPRTLLRSDEHDFSDLSKQQFKTEILGMLFDDKLED